MRKAVRIVAPAILVSEHNGGAPEFRQSLRMALPGLYKFNEKLQCCNSKFHVENRIINVFLS